MAPLHPQRGLRFMGELQGRGRRGWKMDNWKWKAESARLTGLSLRGGRRPTWQSREGTVVSYQLPKKRTDAIGAYHFNGSLFVSAALCRERHAAPLQRHVRLAIVPPNLQSPWCFLPAKGTPHPFLTKKFEKSRFSPCGFCLRVVYFHFVDKKSFGGQHRTIAASTFAGYFSPNALAESCVAALDRIQNRRDCLP